MRKRVSLARTLIYKPETLLLDEPFGALDAQTRMLMQKQLLDLCRELELTVLLVTHDIGEAIALSDKIVLLSGRPARIVEVVDVSHAPTHDVFRRGRGNDELVLAHLGSSCGAGDRNRGHLMKQRGRSISAFTRLKVGAAQVGIVLALTLVWEFSPNWLFEELLWSRPSAIFEQTVVWLADGTLLRNAVVTLKTVVAGMLIGGLVGIMIGLHAGASRVVARLIIGPIEALFALPKITLVPSVHPMDGDRRVPAHRFHGAGGVLLLLLRDV